VIIDTIMAAPGEITLVTLGPLTNIAIALLRQPAIAKSVAHCFVMGGAGAGPGNVTPLAEFNLWCDPEAARTVLRSGMPLTLVGWDVAVASAIFGPQDAAALRGCGPLGEFCVDIQAVLDVYAKESSGIAGFDLPDPMAMAVAIEPSIATVERRHVEVLIGDGPWRGKDVIDWHGVTGEEPNVDIVTHVPRRDFVAMLHRQVTDN
jgi:purine nucleosidase